MRAKIQSQEPANNVYTPAERNATPGQRKRRAAARTPLRRVRALLLSATLLVADRAKPGHQRKLLPL
jgi:hypothetical protein